MCKVTTALTGYLSKEMQLAEISEWPSQVRHTPSWIKVNYRTGVYFIYCKGKLVYLGMTAEQTFAVRINTFECDMRGKTTNHRGKMRYRAKQLCISTKTSDYSYRVLTSPKKYKNNKRYIQMVETLSILLYCKKYEKLPAFNDRLDRRYDLSKSEIAALPKPLLDYYNNEYLTV